jgi:hypothetical protein
MSQAHNLGQDQGSGDGDNVRPRQQSEPHNQPRHSELALTSFVISIIAMILAVGMYIWASIASDRLHQNPPDSAETFVATGVLMACSFVFLSVIGTFLGLIDLFLPKRKKVFAVLGFTLNLSNLCASAILGFVGGVFEQLAAIGKGAK